ncbi:hypothetical protein [Marinobacterium arenosum]|uniref:hypothetical protein n=1 Tax=Marinobacterium arenosum TaxID=2862496 RepID=UPI001C977F99|nr:hypothetical protein [Marinobacterium arenosum]MBY4677947.1 hypothetical protein [Marinobacterium arenosum]
MVYATMILLAISLATASFIKLQQRDLERDFAANAAVHFAQYSQAAASRMFEMGSQFTVAAGYAGGAPPAAGALWLKNPAACAIGGIPTLPNDEAGNPVDDSFVPCDFDDQNIYGHSYTTSWTTVYPGTRMTIQLGPVPFTINGERRDDLGGLIAIKAQALSNAGLGDSTLDVLLRYDFNPTTGALTATIDRTSPFAVDPHLRIDGSNMMDAAAPIRWASGLAITPNGTAMELSAPGGITVQNDATFNGDVEVATGDVTVTAGDLILSAGTATMVDGQLTGVQIDGAFNAVLSHAVYDQRINRSGDTVNKPTCPSGSTPQIFVAAASVPTGEGMMIVDSSGVSRSGSIQRFRTSADDLGSQWQVWAEVYLDSTGWIKLHSSEGDLRSSIKCT